LLDSLEAQGLVSRQAVVEDRRAKKICLSDSARPLIEQIEAISNQLRLELFDGIDEEEIRRCQLIHARILDNLEKR
jgi:MarR family transcriptional regulator for hemolysin